MPLRRSHNWGDKIPRITLKFGQLELVSDRPFEGEAVRKAKKSTSSRSFEGLQSTSFSKASYKDSNEEDAMIVDEFMGDYVHAEPGEINTEATLKIPSENSGFGTAVTISSPLSRKGLSQRRVTFDSQLDVIPSSRKTSSEMSTQVQGPFGTQNAEGLGLSLQLGLVTIGKRSPLPKILKEPPLEEQLGPVTMSRKMCYEESDEELSPKETVEDSETDDDGDNDQEGSISCDGNEEISPAVAADLENQEHSDSDIESQGHAEMPVLSQESEHCAHERGDMDEEIADQMEETSDADVSPGAQLDSQMAEAGSFEDEFEEEEIYLHERPEGEYVSQGLEHLEQDDEDPGIPQDDSATVMVGVEIEDDVEKPIKDIVMADGVEDSQAYYADTEWDSTRDRRSSSNSRSIAGMLSLHSMFEEHI